MKLLLLFFAVAATLGQGAVARYYEPIPLECPVDVEITYVDNVIRGVSYAYVTSSVPVTNTIIQTVTNPVLVASTDIDLVTVTKAGSTVTQTDIQQVETTATVHLTDVVTSFREVTSTVVSIVPLTYSNYITEFERSTATKTEVQLITVFETAVQNVVETVDQNIISTTISTSVVSVTPTSVVQVTSVLQEVETAVQTNTFTEVHSLTKIIEQEVCPQ